VRNINLCFCDTERVLRGIVAIPCTDGLEKTNQIMAMLSLGSAVSAPTGVLYAVYRKMPMFRFLTFVSTYPAATLFACLVVAYSVTIDWFLGVTQIYITLLNLNATGLWQLKLRKAW